ncbi:MAG: hypothetical protein ABIG42_02310 [bacterium]
MGFKAGITILLTAGLGLILFMVFYIFPRQNATVNFVAEKVILNVIEENDGLHLEIQGYFFFENNNPFAVARMIQFPIPPDIGALIPDSVLITDATGNAGGEWEIKRGMNRYPHALNPAGNSFIYRFIFPKMQTKIMACRYIQKLESDEIGYIVKTIHSWGEPIKQGRFDIFLPDGYTLDDMSHEFTKTDVIDVETGEQRLVWRLDVENFLPEKDIRAKVVKTNIKPL